MPKTKEKDGFEFSKTRRTLPMALLRAREGLMVRFRPMLHAHGVTEQQWRALRALHEADEMDATDLAEGASVLSPSLSRILKALEAKQFIVVRRHPDDGRRAMIRLSGQGRAFIEKLAPESAAIYAEIEARVGRDRIETLLNDLDGVIAALEDGA